MKITKTNLAAIIAIPTVIILLILGYLYMAYRNQAAISMRNKDKLSLIQNIRSAFLSQDENMLLELHCKTDDLEFRNDLNFSSDGLIRQFRLKQFTNANIQFLDDNNDVIIVDKYERYGSPSNNKIQLDNVPIYLNVRDQRQSILDMIYTPRKCFVFQE